MSQTESMDDFFLAVSEIDKAEHSADGLDALTQIFGMFPQDWSSGVLKQINANRVPLFERFKEDQALARLVRDLLNMIGCAITDRNDILEPELLQNVASLISTIAGPMTSALEETNKLAFRDELYSLEKTIVAELIKRLDSQIRTLGEMVFTIMQERKVIAHQGCFVLIEMPLGNSIPTKLIEYFLRKHSFSVRTLRVALSRNDKSAEGVTRVELLHEQLKSIQRGDFVIYCDEWITGSNFRNLVDKIDRVISQHECTFLPIGMLAINCDRFREDISAVRRHKKCIKKHGFGDSQSSRFRVRFPQIESKFLRCEYFFWGEHDRISGYRKMQAFGAVFSGIKNVLARLASDDHALKEASIRFLSAVAEQRQITGTGEAIPNDILDHFSTFKQLFLKSYESFKESEVELQAIEDTSNLGNVSGSRSSTFAGLIPKFYEKVSGHPAETCVKIAAIYAAGSGETEMADRYYFQSHVPIIFDLEGEELWFHKLFMELAIEKIESWE
jgi:hypothetical protein